MFGYRAVLLFAAVNLSSVAALQSTFAPKGDKLRSKLESDRDRALSNYLTKLEDDKLSTLASLELEKEQEVDVLKNKLSSLLASAQMAQSSASIFSPSPPQFTRADLANQLAVLKLRLQEKEIDVLTIKILNLQDQLESQLKQATTKNKELQRLKTRQIRTNLDKLKSVLSAKEREKRCLAVQARKLEHQME